MKEQVIRVIYDENGNSIFALMYNGEGFCDGCVFENECAGDGDGTPAEGIGCESGYVWKDYK